MGREVLTYVLFIQCRWSVQAAPRYTLHCQIYSLLANISHHEKKVTRLLFLTMPWFFSICIWNSADFFSCFYSFLIPLTKCCPHHYSWLCIISCTTCDYCHPCLSQTRAIAAFDWRGPQSLTQHIPGNMSDNLFFWPWNIHPLECYI